jgi:hypothetical protein
MISAVPGYYGLGKQCNGREITTKTLKRFDGWTSSSYCSVGLAATVA